jgi:hypothetical protein
MCKKMTGTYVTYGENSKSYKDLVRKHEGKNQFTKPLHIDGGYY